MHNETTKMKAIELWNAKRTSGMTLEELTEMCTTVEEGKILSRKVDNADINAVSAYKASKKQPANEQTRQQKCKRCGENHQKRFCKAKNLHCNFCNVNSHGAVPFKQTSHFFF